MMGKSTLIKNRLRSAIRYSDPAMNVYIDSFNKLDDEDQEVIADCVEVLIASIPHRLGVLGSLELLARIGIYMNGGDNEQRDYPRQPFRNCKARE